MKELNCIENKCIEKASYNYKTRNNPAFCYKHKKSGMKKKDYYSPDDVFEILFYYLEKPLFWK